MLTVWLRDRTGASVTKVRLDKICAVRSESTIREKGGLGREGSAEELTKGYLRQAKAWSKGNTILSGET